jgi:large subunit ribosomal protein L19
MKPITMKFTPVNTDARTKLALRAGDTVRVFQKIQEKDKTRLQAFEGMVLSVKHGTQPGATFTVRKVTNGVGVERIFPLYSPVIDKIEVVRRAKVRRAKLYYIREKAAKEIRSKTSKLIAGSGVTSTAEAEAPTETKEETAEVQA